MSLVGGISSNCPDPGTTVEQLSKLEATVFEVIFGMELAVDCAFMTAEIFGRDEHQFVDVESYGEMCRILELIQDIASQVRHMPSHAERWDGAENAARIKLPAVVGIIQVTMWGKVVAGDHYTFLHPTCCCTGRRYRFGYSILRVVAVK